MKRKKNLYLTGTYILLTVLAVIWLIPIIWIFLTSFRGEGANAVPYFFPKTYTFNNYIKLFTSDAYPFGKWFINTFIVATCTCILSTLITVGKAYSLSLSKFKHRNGFLKLALVLNMFPWIHVNDCGLLHFEGPQFDTNLDIFGLGIFCWGSSWFLHCERFL